jgi:phosphatidylinositol alpha-1,6-mannosyltransferase
MTLAAHRAPVRVAWVTNDLPPDTGGIQQFIASLLERTADQHTVVLGPSVPAARRAEADAYDRSVPGRVIRAPGRLLPTRAALRWLSAQLAEADPDVVIIGSVWPLGILAGGIGRASGAPVLGISHGAEAGIGRGPGRFLLRRATRGLSALTYISEFTRRPVARAVGTAALTRLPPGVDLERFARPVPTDGAAVGLRDVLRRRWGIEADAPVVGCIARLVPRKGQDMLLRAWPEVARRHPGARLVIVGEGPARRRLERAAGRMPTAHVVGPVSWEELPGAYAALDVFAMPVRTRFGGLDVEGFGISLLEAQAAGLPVVVGRSGGAPETLTDPRVGTLVDGRDVAEVVAALDRWLTDEAARAQARVLAPAAVERWSWDRIAADLQRSVAALVAPPE